MTSSQRRWPAASVIALVAAGFTFAACRDEPTRPTAPPATASAPRPLGAVAGGPVSGAIFTTTPNGAVVNANTKYTDKIQVYLDGGPGPNAPQTAAGLDDGDYIFQVTDPSGGVLLSQDPAWCREVHVSGGIITGYYTGRTYGNNVACDVQYSVDGVAGPAGQHDVNTDTDHGGAGAKVVQLMPFLDTPNNGGVYKAWMTPIAAYTAKGGDLSALPSALPKVKGKVIGYAPDPGFGTPRAPAKTDNFKVKGTVVPPLITVAKFHDVNMNGVQDQGEASIPGWGIAWTEPAPSSTTDHGFTPLSIAAGLPGNWLIVEDTPSGTLETVARLDGSIVSQYPSADPLVTVPIAGTSGETHAVVYGDVGLGPITACKVYANNTHDPIAGWRVSIQRVKDAAGNAVSGSVDTQVTGSNGCYTWSNLLPGEYVVTEVMALNYQNVGPISYTVDLTSTLTFVNSTPVLAAVGSVGGTAIANTTVTFTNECFGTANFSTKGYWSNQNGVTEMTQADINYANTLAPYSSQSSYYGGEPFDGLLPGGVPAPAVQGNDGAIAAANAGAGSAKAEVSYFLTLSNAGGDPRQQLAQQLLAFIFNSRHRLTSLNDQIVGPDLTVYSAQGLINSAISAWQAGGSSANTMSALLDWFNNHESSTIQTVPATACAVTYPVPG